MSSYRKRSNKQTNSCVTTVPSSMNNLDHCNQDLDQQPLDSYARSVLEKLIFHTNKVCMASEKRFVMTVSLNVENNCTDLSNSIKQLQNSLKLACVVAFSINKLSIDHCQSCAHKLDHYMKAYGFKRKRNELYFQAEVCLLIYRRISSKISDIAFTFLNNDSMDAIVACFYLGNMPICVVAANVLKNIHNFDDTSSVEALKCQTLCILINTCSFYQQGGFLKRIMDFPLTIFLNCKNYGSKGTISSQFNDLKLLQMIDVQWQPKMLLVPAVEKIVTIVKVEKFSLYSRGFAESAVFQIEVPLLDTQKAYELCSNFVPTLLNGKSLKSQKSNFLIYPNVICVKKILPFTPLTLKVVFKNSNNHPILYSLLCLSKEEPTLIPLWKHSFLYSHQRAFQANDVNDLNNQSWMIASPASNLQHALMAYTKHKTVGIAEKAHQCLNKLYSKKHRHRFCSYDRNKLELVGQTQAGSAITSPSFLADDQSLDSVTNSLKDFNDLSLHNVVELEAVDKTGLIKTVSKESLIDLSRWIYVDAPEGIINSKSEIEFQITVFVGKAILQRQKITTRLIVQVEPFHDHLVIEITAMLRPSIRGLSLEELQELECISFKQWIRAQNLSKKYHMNQNLSLCTINSKMPFPKELWWMLEYLYYHSNSSQLIDFFKQQIIPSTNFFVANYSLSEQANKIIKTLERGRKLNKLETTHLAVFEALSQFLLTLPAPILPSECLTLLDVDQTDADHLICRAVLLSLPRLNRNFLISFISLLHYLIEQEIRRCGESIVPMKLSCFKRAIILWSSMILTKQAAASAISLSILTHFFQ